LISFQIDLVPAQYLIGKVFKSSRHSAVVSARSYVVVMGLIFTLGMLAQVGERHREVENTQKKLFDVLPFGYHLRRSARASKPSWRPNP
jgi:hypothetical protein